MRREMRAAKRSAERRKPRVPLGEAWGEAAKERDEEKAQSSSSSSRDGRGRDAASRRRRKSQQMDQLNGVKKEIRRDRLYLEEEEDDDGEDEEDGDDDKDKEMKEKRERRRERKRGKEEFETSAAANGAAEGREGSKRGSPSRKGSAESNRAGIRMANSNGLWLSKAEGDGEEGRDGRWKK